MTYLPLHARSGLTAIAAVLALSSTPIPAQDVSGAPSPAVETIDSPVPETAPERAESVAATVESPTAEPEAAEAKVRATATRRAAATRTPSATTTRRSSREPVSNTDPATTTPVAEATAEAMPLPPPEGATTDPGPMPVEENVVEATAPADEALPIAAAAGLGLLALGGIGMAIGRRRRRKEELAHIEANRHYLDTHPVADTPRTYSPSYTGAVARGLARPTSVHSEVPRTKLPAGFDLSRFGPHVQAAYLGPTADNPSLSLKNRLRRAAAMDQQARQQSTKSRPAEHRDAGQGPAMPSLRNAHGANFLLRRASTSPTPKPEFQH